MSRGKLGRALRLCKDNVRLLGGAVNVSVTRSGSGCWCRIHGWRGDVSIHVPAQPTCGLRMLAIRCSVYRDPFPPRLGEFFIIFLLVAIYVVSFAAPSTGLAVLIAIAIVASLVPSALKSMSEWYASRRAERLMREASMAVAVDPDCRRLAEKLSEIIGGG